MKVILFFANNYYLVMLTKNPRNFLWTTLSRTRRDGRGASEESRCQARPNGPHRPTIDGLGVGLGWGWGVGVSKCQAVAKDSISHLSVGSVVGESQISEELALTRQAACGLIGQHT